MPRWYQATKASTGVNGATRSDQRVYEVRVAGPAPAPELIRQLEDAELVREEVCTVVTGRFPDLAALHGLLNRLRAYGLDVVEIRRLVDAPPATATRSRSVAYELTIAGPIGPVVRRALEPHVVASSRTYSIFRTAAISADALFDVVRRLARYGCDVNSLYAYG